MENQFDPYVKSALQLCSCGQQGLDTRIKIREVVRRMYLYHENNIIDDSLNIIMPKLDIQVLEDIVRLYCDIRFFIDSKFNTITIIDLPLGQPDNIPGDNGTMDEFVRWFVKFFYYLEAIELSEAFPNRACYNINTRVTRVFKSRFVKFPVNVFNRKFSFVDLRVKIN